jgi:hypothetical protein
LKYGTIEKENMLIWDIKHQKSTAKLIIQNALNYLSSFLLQFHTILKVSSPVSVVLLES